jgi:hypothetical protein
MKVRVFRILEEFHKTKNPTHSHVVMFQCELNQHTYTSDCMLIFPKELKEMYNKFTSIVKSTANTFPQCQNIGIGIGSSISL